MPRSKPSPRIDLHEVDVKKGNRTTVKCVGIGGMEHRYTDVYVFLIKILKVKLIQWLQAHLAELSSSNSGFIDWLFGVPKNKSPLYRRQIIILHHHWDARFDRRYEIAFQFPIFNFQVSFSSVFGGGGGWWWWWWVATNFSVSSRPGFRL